MDPQLIGMIGGAGMGLLKSNEDEAKANRQRQLAATTALYSPWTGMKPNEVQEASTMGATLGGAAQGAALGQSFGNYETNKELTGLQRDYYKQKLASGWSDDLKEKMGASDLAGMSYGKV
jgi:hypothetical protein